MNLGLYVGVGVPKISKVKSATGDQQAAAPQSFRSDLEAWSKDRPLWQRHALWLLATKPEIGAAEFEALEHCLMKEVGLVQPTEGEQPETLFEASHLRTEAAQPLRLVAVSNVANVNRLDSSGLSFQPNGLTIIYGENGSGKTGFIRVLRKACRTRLEKPDHLEILANIYGATKGVASAEITIHDNGTDLTIPWVDDGSATDERLSAFSVFDTRSAQLYVDEGNKLRFLPSDLDIPFRLNEIIIAVEGRITPKLREVDALIQGQSSPFDEVTRITSARKFYSSMSGTTTDAAIDAACLFSEDNKLRLTNLNEALGAQPTQIAELRGKANASRTLCARLKGIEDAFNATSLAALVANWKSKVDAQSARDAARDLITGKDPLGNVGSNPWKQLWQAAQQYAVEADATHKFPDTGPQDQSGSIVCPLCQQKIEAAKDRLARFSKFMSDKTASTLIAAENALNARMEVVGKVDCSLSDAEALLVESVRGLDADLAEAVTKRFAETATTKANWVAYVGVGEEPAALAADELIERLTKAAGSAEKSAETISQAQDATARALLVAEAGELEDRRRLSLVVAALKGRRNYLQRRDGFNRALTACRRTEVTKKANYWVDVHVTEQAKKLFGKEIKRLNLGHLKVELSRQSSATETRYKNTLGGGTGFRRVSDVLSEGEQRALSLAAFFTEAALERPGGTLIIDDPVSSLDRRRSGAVAEKIVEECKARQVIVFTHDLMFLEELGEAGKQAGIEPVCLRVFSTADIAGKVDEAGSAWKGQPVEKRLNYLDGKLAQLKKLHGKSQTEYEIEAKNLYGRLRDALERFVEERLFRDVVVRYRDEVRTKMLRYVSLPDDIAKHFHQAFSKASLHSHDNPGARDVTPPDPPEIEADLAAFRQLMTDVEKLQKANDGNRPEMK